MSKRYQIIFNLFALAVIIFIGVDLFYMIFRAQLREVDTQKIIIHRLPDIEGHGKEPLDYYRAIVKRNIFGSEEESSKEIRTEEIEDLQPTALKLSLLGTVTGSQQNAFAVIEEINTKKQGLYRVGDSVQSATVKNILRGKVILRVKDRDEILTMEETTSSGTEKEYLRSKPIEKRETVMVSSSELQESIKNVHQLLSQARIRPHFKDGRSDGLAITNIKAGSIFSRLGLRNGDIIRGINGRNIKSPDDVFEMYRKLKSSSRIALEIVRGGEQKIIKYEFR